MDENIEVRDLIIMEHYGIISPEDNARLTTILASSEEARNLQAEIKAAIPQVTAQAFMKEIDIDKVQMLNLVKKEHLTRMRYKKQSRQHWLAAAAVLLIGALTGMYFLYPLNHGDQHLTTLDKNSGIKLLLADGQTIMLQDSGQQTITAGQVQLSNTNRVLTFNHEMEAASGWNMLTVPTRLDYKVELSDGSVVWLNSTSSMRFPFAFTGGKREVFIEGEAYFEIAADPQRPFVVHVNGSDIQVLGTSFNVNAYFPGKLSTSLINGKVAVVTGNERTVLEPGKEAITTPGGQTKVRDFDAQITLGWKQGVHYFQDASILEIADMIPRWFNEKIIIDDPKAAEATFRIKIYRHQPLKKFIDQINSTGTVSLYYKDGQLHCKSI